MKSIENMRLTSPFTLTVAIFLGVAITFWILINLAEDLNDQNKLLKSENQTLEELEKLPFQVKILEPNTTGISFDGVTGEIWWLEGSPFSETDFTHVDSEGFKSSIKEKEIIKVPPKAVGYILRGRISEKGFTVDHYFNLQKIDPDSTPENDSY